MKSVASPVNCARRPARLRRLLLRQTAEDGSRRTTRYDIDLFKCIFCGYCQESCPVDAIVETRLYEYHFTSREDGLMTKEKLLAVGDKYESQIAADVAAQAKYR